MTDPESTPLIALPGVGPKTASRLAEANLRTISDLLLLQPVRYEDRRQTIPVVALRAGGFAVVPHLLIMTATPIPRTVALTAFGDLDVSVIDELPLGRKPVVTHLYGADRRTAIYQKVAEAVAEGRRAFAILPRVDEGELVLTDAVSTHAWLSTGPLANARVGLVHGRLPTAEKAARFADFAEGRLDVLVATTVVEVGIDIPEATVMVIEHAERYGLSQLHQLRGRIARGVRAGDCYLLIGPSPTPDAQTRLRILLQTTDGFEIAEADLKMRGPGAVLGAQQSGTGAEIIRWASDGRLLAAAQKEAHDLWTSDPGLDAHPQLAARIHRRWSHRLAPINAG